uniref:GTP-binding protein Rheb isoform 2 n=1 Tax=Entosiphon sulcatum TaxID=101493 RepID=A0A2R4IKV8_9EUGL|nr:GTP-binding protein Rheb isoform 2 [Entosiphon sulcatum]|eukprot:TRINITY_DN68330_c0_g1_i1.p1 TRINITY_DN68330_c0_g1~~TRINITY_DN68330_c0_g1_i1.p1  ORF type:complete len:210 (+),score=38.48 TRINITY_DN68330_c0_g1_i1:31-660(+)
MGCCFSHEDKPEKTPIIDTRPADSQQCVRQRKVVLLGYAAVGKTAISQQFVEEKFPVTYYSTVDQTLVKRLKVRGEEFHLSVLDTAAQDECSLFQPQYSIGTQGYILVYSIAERRSFEICKTVYDRLHCEVVDAAVVLVGNKIDLEKQRQVPTEEAQALAQSWGCPFVEVSAKKKDSVNRIFTMLVDEILTREEGSARVRGSWFNKTPR